MRRNSYLAVLAAIGMTGMPYIAMAQTNESDVSSNDSQVVSVSTDDAATAAAAATAVVDAASTDVQSEAESSSQPAASSESQTYDVYVVPADSNTNEIQPAEVLTEPRTRDSLLGIGGSIVFNIGPNYSFKDKLYTSGDRSLIVPTAGLEASIDLGFKYKYVGVFFEVMFRGGTAMDDDVHYHCPSRFSGMDDKCFKYYAIEKGDWDTYYMGLGAMLSGYIPMNSWVFATIGVGFITYLGRTIDGDEAAYNYAVKVSAGVNFAVTPDIALGFALNYEGMTDRRQSLQPAFSLIYNY